MENQIWLYKSNKSFFQGRSGQSGNKRQNPDKKELKELQFGMDREKTKFKIMKCWGVAKDSKED